MRIWKKTINYWLTSKNLVFIFLVDVANKNAYFINVHKFIRNKYERLINNNEAFLFSFNKEFDLVSDVGKTIFFI